MHGGVKCCEACHEATNSMTTVLGRMATCSGQVVRWEDAVAKGTSEFPATLAWDVKATVCPNNDGDYPIPVPGVFKPYRGRAGPLVSSGRGRSPNTARPCCKKSASPNPLAAAGVGPQRR